MSVARTVGIPEERAVLNARDLQHLTGLHRTTLYRLMAEGQIPGVRRLGGRVFVSREIFTRWLDSADRPRGRRRV